jgi:hypothetical protein
MKKSDWFILLEIPFELRKRDRFVKREALPHTATE